MRGKSAGRKKRRAECDSDLFGAWAGAWRGTPREARENSCASIPCLHATLKARTRIRTHPSERVGTRKPGATIGARWQKQTGTGKSACATQGFGPTLPKGWGTRKIGATIGARGKNKWAQARVPVPLKDSDPPFRKGGAPEKSAPQSALEPKTNGHRQECLCHSSQPFRRRRRLLREDATQNDKRGTGRRNEAAPDA